MEVKETREVMVVGGGTAGWMTALFLAKDNPELKVSLIGSADVPTIGVGESTVSNVQYFFSELGISEAEWMSHCDAIYKYGIYFKDWNQAESEWWHFLNDFYPDTFLRRSASEFFKSRRKIAAEKSLIDYWLSVDWGGGDLPHSLPAWNECFNEYYELSVKAKAPYKRDGTQGVVSERPGYGYHFDANKLVKYLRSLAERFNVKLYDVQISGAELAEDGSISSLRLSDGRSLHADVFADCTGLKRVLIGQHTSFIDYEKCLNDRALLVHLHYTDQKSQMVPYTQSFAKNFGWIWGIPLAKSLSSAYVYSSAFLNPEQAFEEYKRFWESRSIVVDEHSAKIIEFKSGKMSSASHQNLVALGLSASFIEPLESTAIALTISAIRLLSSLLKMKGGWSEQKSKKFSDICRRDVDRVYDFVIAHYYLSGRNDNDYWRSFHGEEKGVIIAKLWQRYQQLNASPANSQLPGFHSPLNQFNIASLLIGNEQKVPDDLKLNVDVLDEQLLRVTMEFLRQKNKIHADQCQDLYTFIKNRDMT